MLFDVSRISYVLFLCMIAACGDNVTDPGSPEVTLEARRGHVMVFDEARHQMVLFGGWGAEEGAPPGDRGSTWALNGSTWSRVANTGPSPRHNAVAVYDAARQRILLYGGIIGSFPNEQTLSDTWEWNGTAWSKVADTGPTPRVHLNMGYDRARGRVVLYGGFSLGSMTELRDIWEWNGTSWMQQPVNGPPNTVARGVAFDEKAGALVLFSASEDPGTSAVHMDVWNGTSLVRLAASAPNCIGNLVSLGAIRGGFVSAAWCQSLNAFRSDVWNGTSWTSVAGTNPSPRGSHAMAYDRDRDRVVLYGGEAMPNGPLLSDTWEFNGTSWSQVSGAAAISLAASPHAAPPGRRRSLAAALP
ncbi:MAG TPA: kelch repeat-containing protein [Gemmatimonadaceae bacterium]|nr:kelch repeat-containing protein [Gemmatimonadaceae bacterium]